MENFHHIGSCPIQDVLSKLGDKWTMLIMVTLKMNGTMRFCDIQKTTYAYGYAAFVGNGWADSQESVCGSSSTCGIFPYGNGI